jgi:hypothetical protein
LNFDRRSVPLFHGNTRIYAMGENSKIEASLRRKRRKEELNLETKRRKEQLNRIRKRIKSASIEGTRKKESTLTRYRRYKILDQKRRRKCCRDEFKTKEASSARSKRKETIRERNFQSVQEEKEL